MFTMTDQSRSPTADASGVRLRKATSADLRSFLAPLSPAFGEEITETQFEDGLNTFEPDRVVGAFDGDEPVGCAGAYTFRLAIPGGEVGAAGVTLVGVSPSHRRRGILRQLMRQQLDEVHERGEPVAVLWASEGAIYQRFGYGLATLQGSFEIERTRASFGRPAEPAGRVRFVAPDDALRPFSDVYERVRSTLPGALSRSEQWWRWNILRDAEYMRQGRGPKFLALYEVDDAPEGYVVYRVKSDWDERGPKSELLVVELVAVTPRAERDLWRWVLDLDLVARIRAIRQPVPHPLLLLLAEPRRLGLALGDGLWLRLVDLPTALAARSYARPGRIVLEVSDSFCPWNAGRWRLEATVADGAGTPSHHARVSPTAAQAHLALDVADLGAAYLGGIRFEELHRTGRIQELRSGAVRAADALFTTDRAPWCSTMF